MPSGRMLIAGPFLGDWWFLKLPGPNSFTWEDVPNARRDRVWGTAVPMPEGPAGSTRSCAPAAAPGTYVDTTELAGRAPRRSTSAASSGWQPAPPMKVGRAHHNTVLLPDGSMATVGGGVGIRNGDQW